MNDSTARESCPIPSIEGLRTLAVLSLLSAALVIGGAIMIFN